PGYFHRRLEQDVGGMAMFLVGDNGSMEDLITDPPLSTADHPECNTGCFAQVEATGTKIADEVAARLGNAIAVPIGSVGGRRTGTPRRCRRGTPARSTASRSGSETT